MFHPSISHRGAGQVQSDRHRRIEGAPADGTRAVGARDDAETDGQGKVLALLLLVLPDVAFDVLCWLH